MKKVAITGSNGFLGARILQAYEQSYDVVGLAHKDLDIADRDQVMRVLALCRPDFVIHCAAISDTGYAQNHPEEAYRINVTGSENIALGSKEVGAKLVYMSSDQVYNGNKELCALKEEDAATPLSEYGLEKMEAERRIADILPEAVGLRLTWMYDLPNFRTKINSNILWNIIRAGMRGEALFLSMREQRGMTYVREAVLHMEQAMELPGGVYNYGSGSDKNSYEIAVYAAALLQCQEQTIAVDEGKFRERIRNLAMDTEKIRKQNICFSNTLDGIKRCLEDYGYISC